MKREAVGLFGLAVLLVSFAFPSIYVKPNRVAEGLPLHFFSIGADPLFLSVRFATLSLIAAGALLILVPILRGRLTRRLVVFGLLLPILPALLAAGGNDALAGSENGAVAPALG